MHKKALYASNTEREWPAQDAHSPYRAFQKIRKCLTGAYIPPRALRCAAVNPRLLDISKVTAPRGTQGSTSRHENTPGPRIVPDSLENCSISPHKPAAQ